LNRSYQYDAAGNTLSDGQRTFTYNDAGRMITATQNSLTTSYQYNALGQRVKKTNATTTYFVYDEAGHLAGEYDQAGNLIEELVWLGDIPVASIRNNEQGNGVGVFYIHTDHLNAPTKLTRSTDNQIVWRWDHDPYGNGTPNEDPDGNGLFVNFNLRYPGQYFDQETGLLYNYFRYYDPTTGKYITSDPIGLEGGINTYAYSGGDPLANFDIDGLEVRIVGHIAAPPLGTITRPISYHTAIYMKPDDECGCQGTWPMTVGGQREKHNDKHMLVTKFNYPDDALSNAMINQIVSTPPGMTDCEFIKRIIAAAHSYDNSAPYSFPEHTFTPGNVYMAPGHYNSNSYVAGVLQAAGAPPPQVRVPGRAGGAVPGYENPLPISKK
jgi:RHS repeat-associated protein